MTELIEKIEAIRRQDGRDDATAAATAAKLSEYQRRERIRERNRGLWREYELQMAENHHRLAEEHLARAQAIERGEKV